MDATEEAEYSLVASEAVVTKDGGPSSNVPSEPVSSGSANPVAPVSPLVDFDPSDLFWVSLLGLSSVGGTSGGVSWPPISIPLVPIYYPVPSSPSTLLYILAYYLSI